MSNLEESREEKQNIEIIWLRDLPEVSVQSNVISKWSYSSWAGFKMWYRHVDLSRADISQKKIAVLFARHSK